MSKDYYKILGVSKDSTKDDIKKAYRKIAMKYHPDKNPDKAAEDKFKEASDAYSVLSDDEKKSKYDRYGSSAFDGQTHQHQDINDIFRNFGFNFGGGFEDMFGSRFGGGGQRTTQTIGSDARINIKLTLKEILHGTKKKIKINKKVHCNHCSGSGSKDKKLDTCPQCNGQGRVTRTTRTPMGHIQQVVNCNVCNGQGKIIKNKCPHCVEGLIDGSELIEINIPKGIIEGMQMKMNGKGNAGKRSGINGNLIIIFSEEKHKELERKDENLYYKLDIDVFDAMLGTKKEIPTIENKVKIQIDKGTQPNKIIRLKGKGLPKYGYNHIGDLYIEINVIIPEKLNKEQTKLVKELKEKM